MRIRWRAATMVLPVLAALAACGRDAAQPLEPSAAPARGAIPGSGNGGYYGSGHADPSPVPSPPDVEDSGV